MSDRIDHYAEAERLANGYREAHKQVTAAWQAHPAATEAERAYEWRQTNELRCLLDKAQVHATLALVDAVRDQAKLPEPPS